jgi:hypothetical protein
LHPNLIVIAISIGWECIGNNLVSYHLRRYYKLTSG